MPGISKQKEIVERHEISHFFLIQQFSVSEKQNGKGFGISYRIFSIKHDTESH